MRPMPGCGGGIVPHAHHTCKLQNDAAMLWAMARLSVLHTSDVDASTLSRVRTLLVNAFPPPEFTDDDWEHTLGGLHVLCHEDGRLIALDVCDGSGCATRGQATVAWHFDFRGPSTASPLAIGSRIVFDGRTVMKQGQLLAVDDLGGSAALAWRRVTAEAMNVSPAQDPREVPAMILGSCLAGIDSTVVAVALPTIGRNLKPSTGSASTSPSDCSATTSATPESITSFETDRR